MNVCRPLLLRHVPFLAGIVCAVVGVCGTIAPTGVFAEVSKVTVFDSGTEGYNTYRIPTIVKAVNGDLLAIAEGRKNSSSDAGDIDLVMKRSTDNGQTWSALQLIQDEYENPTASITIGNPTPVVDTTDPLHPGRIWLPFSRNNDRVFVTYSDDNGATWSDRTEITSSVKDPTWGWYATGPVHGIQLQRGDHAGRLIIPSDHRLSANGLHGSHVVYSDDHGATWQIGGVDTGEGAILPSEHVAVELVDERIYFNSRNNRGTNPVTRVVTYSSDGGETFEGPFEPEPNISSPVVQNSALRFAATDQGDPQNILLYSSPANPTSRRDMTILMSFNEGATWTNNMLIDAGPAAYSDLIKLDNTTAGVLYEAGASSAYEEIIFAVFPVEPNFTPWNGIEGDVNQDGVFNSDDVDAFVAVWAPLSEERYPGGAESYTHGDLNFDGINNLSDVVVLRKAAMNAGLSAAPLEALFAAPEPTCGLLIITSGASWVLWRPTRRSVFRFNCGSYLSDVLLEEDKSH